LQIAPTDAEGAKDEGEEGRDDRQCDRCGRWRDPVDRTPGRQQVGRVIGDHYRPIGPARGMSSADERFSSDGRADRWHAIKALGLHRFWQTMLLLRGNSPLKE
jgi:hypothetical protein